jgi:hypothetical protein
VLSPLKNKQNELKTIEDKEPRQSLADIFKKG